MSRNAEDIKVEIINKILTFLKKDKSVQGMFSRYNIPIEKIHEAPICFAELPVSAKTKKGKIYINNQFLRDGSFSKEIHYLVHELCHWLQQICGDPFDMVPEKKVPYLDIPAELEAFAFQVRFMQDFYGKDVAEDYVENLLDFHNISGEDRENRRKVFLKD